MTDNQLREKARKLAHRPYPVAVFALPPEDGGGWFAYLPDFGHSACSATGDTRVKALHLLSKVAEEVVLLYLERDLPIPEPTLWRLEGRQGGKNWRPMDQAPKDKRIILHYPDRESMVAIGTWNDDRYSKRPRPFWSNERDSQVAMQRWHQPDKWMPLPDPPED